MRCPSCGSEVAPEMGFCSNCGHQFRGPLDHTAPKSPDAEKGERNTTVLIAVIIVAVVAISIIMSAVLYVIVLSQSGTGPNVPLTTLTSYHIEDGIRFNFSSFTHPTQWTEITIMLSDGQDPASWSPDSDDLDGFGTITAHYPPRSLGTNLRVWCNVTDIHGDGYIDQGDYFTFTTGSSYSFSPLASYTVTILWDPAAAPSCSSSFKG